MAAPAKLLYRLNNLEYSNVVQRAYVGATYVYALQLINGQNDVVISRAVKPTTGYDVDYTGCEQMFMKNFGHGQTWEYFEHNGEDYWIIATKPNEDGWATQIGRVKFEANSYDTTPYTSNTTITRLAELNHATNGSAFTMHRVDAALSTSKEWLLLGGIDTSGNCHFSYFNNETINNLMDEVDATHGFVDISQHTDDILGAYTLDDIDGKLPYDSVQGFDFSDGRAIYISSGHSAANANPDAPSITKFFWDNQSGEQVTTYNTNWKPTSSDTWTQNVETEGVQIATDDLYLGISYHNAANTETTENRVYYIPKTYWS